MWPPFELIRLACSARADKHPLPAFSQVKGGRFVTVARGQLFRPLEAVMNTPLTWRGRGYVRRFRALHAFKTDRLKAGRWFSWDRFSQTTRQACLPTSTAPLGAMRGDRARGKDLDRLSPLAGIAARLRSTGLVGASPAPRDCFLIKNPALCRVCVNG